MKHNQPVRVLVVDDSPAARAVIRALIEAAPGLAVCGEAANGREAVEQVLSLAPDIITMDLQMPEMDGMQAIEEIMAQRAVPILVLSDLSDGHHAMAAIARGALEVACKPTSDEGAQLANRLRLLARIPVIRHIRRTGTPAPSLATPTAADRAPNPAAPPLVVIAASTGGPQALARILSELPGDFPAPVMIAQHISDGFAAAMADWLDDLCPLRVTLGREGEPLQPGHVYLADSLTHMTLGPGQYIRLVPRRDKDIYRPSCDRLLASVADQLGASALALILTGMGRDGVNGMLAIRRAGGMTIAQDEPSSVIFGMNREAILAGGVQKVLPLDRIAAELQRQTMRTASP